MARRRWTYKVPDGAFDFLAAGEKLTLTYNATVDNNYLPADQTGSGQFTITITGTNDVPVITSCAAKHQLRYRRHRHKTAAI